MCVNFDEVTIVVSWSCWTGRQVITGAACGKVLGVPNVIPTGLTTGAG